MDPAYVSLISACTALIASIVGPMVTLSVSRRQFAANVLSANRQRRMESIRDLLAELIAQVVAVIVIKKGRGDSWDENLAVAAHDGDLIKRIERIVLLQWKIRLILNPEKPNQAALSDSLESLLERLKKPGVPETEIRPHIEEITRLSQNILRHEWDRVKRGE